MANLLQIPSSSNSDFHFTRRSMCEQNILFRRQNSIIYSPFTRSGFLKPRLNQPSVNGNSYFPFVALLGQDYYYIVYFSFIILNKRRSSYEQSTQALVYSGVGIWFTYSGAAIWFRYLVPCRYVGSGTLVFWSLQNIREKTDGFIELCSRFPWKLLFVWHNSPLSVNEIERNH